MLYLTRDEVQALMDLILNDERGEYDVDLASVIRFLIARAERREAQK